MEIYRSYISRIEDALKRLSNPFEKLEYLNRQKADFCLNNRGADADMVILWFDSIAKSIRHLSFLEKKIDSPASKLYQKGLSYKWIADKFYLEDLYDKTKGKLILESTHKDVFMAVFNAKPLRDITPVFWHDDNASELIYFILKLGENGYIHETKRTNYKQMTACFYKEDGAKWVSKSFRSLKQKLEYNLSEQKRCFINKLIGELD